MSVEGRVALGVAIALVVVGGGMWAMDYNDRQLAASRSMLRELQFEQLRIQAEGNNLTPRQQKLVKQISDTAVLNHDRILDSLLSLATNEKLDSAYRAGRSR